MKRYLILRQKQNAVFGRLLSCIHVIGQCVYDSQHCQQCIAYRKSSGVLTPAQSVIVVRLFVCRHVCLTLSVCLSRTLRSRYTGDLAGSSL